MFCVFCKHAKNCAKSTESAFLIVCRAFQNSTDNYEVAWGDCWKSYCSCKIPTFFHRSCHAQQTVRKTILCAKDQRFRICPVICWIFQRTALRLNSPIIPARNIRAGNRRFIEHPLLISARLRQTSVHAARIPNGFLKHV